MSDVKMSGPIFNGQAESAMDRGTVAVRKAVADRGEALVRSAMAVSIQHHGSGRAERSVTTTDKSRAYQTGKYTLPVTCGPGETIVTTELASYGPWLEGTGSRNVTTQFKGYFSFRLASQAMEVESEDIGDRAIQPYLREAD